jgi:NAD(P)-dependent dehydrogenase (short-subunit alcohol dehydrogenase family)
MQLPQAERRKNLGPIDIVVNNAGMVQVGRDEPSAPLKDTSDAD